MVSYRVLLEVFYQFVDLGEQLVSGLFRCFGKAGPNQEYFGNPLMLK